MKLGSIEFKQLKLEWDKKLAESGFRDIERMNGILKHDYAEHSFISRHRHRTRKAKFEYYRWLAQEVDNETFECRIERHIMIMASNGFKRTEIVMSLKKLGHHLDRHTIGYIIRRFEHKKGIKTWTAAQLDLVKLP